MKVIKGLISLILIAFIVINLVMIGMLLQVRNIVSKEGVEAIVSSLDASVIYDQIDDDTKEEIGYALEQAGIPKENIGAILETEAAKEIVSTVIGTYKDELFSGQPIADLEILSPEMLESVFNVLDTHEKELTYAMFGRTDSDALAQYRAMIGELKQAYEENKDSIPKTVGELPGVVTDPDGTTTIDNSGYSPSDSIHVSVAGHDFTGDDLMKVLHIATGWVPIGIVGGLTLLLLLFLLLMWRKRLNFLVWYAIPFLLSAAFFLVMNVFRREVPNVVADMSIDANLAPTVETLALRMIGSFRTYGLILAGAAILCIVLYGLFHKSKKDEPPQYDTPRFVNDAQ